MAGLPYSLSQPAGTADAEIKDPITENPVLYMILSFKPEVGMVMRHSMLLLLPGILPNFRLLIPFNEVMVVINNKSVLFV